MSNKIIVPEGRVLVQALPNDKEGIYTIQCPINLLDESKWLIADKVGERVYNPRPIAGTSFVKAWYEVQDVADHTLTPDPEPDYEWVKVVEGGSVDIDEETIVKDDTTDELKVNLDNESLKYDSTDDNIKVNIDNESLKYNDTDDCVEVNIDKQTIIKDATTDELKVNLDNDTLWCPMENIKVKYNNDTLTTNSDGLQLTGVLPTLVADTNIQFGKTGDGKWGYKVGADSVVPFSTRIDFWNTECITRCRENSNGALVLKPDTWYIGILHNNYDDTADIYLSVGVYSGTDNTTDATVYVKYPDGHIGQFDGSIARRKKIKWVNCDSFSCTSFGCTVVGFKVAYNSGDPLVSVGVEFTHSNSGRQGSGAVVFESDKDLD